MIRPDFVVVLCVHALVSCVVFVAGCLGCPVLSSQWPDDCSSDISHAPHVTSAHPLLPYPPIHSALCSLLPYRLLSSSRSLFCFTEDCCNVAISLSLRRFDYLRLLLRTLRSLTVSAACSGRSTTTALCTHCLRGQRLTAFAIHIHPCRTHSPLLPVYSESQPRVGSHRLCVFLRGCAIAKYTSIHHYLPQPTATNVSFHLSLQPLSLPSKIGRPTVSPRRARKNNRKIQKNS